MTDKQLEALYRLRDHAGPVHHSTFRALEDMKLAQGSSRRARITPEGRDLLRDRDDREEAEKCRLRVIGARTPEAKSMGERVEAWVRALDITEDWRILRWANHVGMCRVLGLAPGPWPEAGSQEVYDSWTDEIDVAYGHLVELDQAYELAKARGGSVEVRFEAVKTPQRSRKESLEVARAEAQKNVVAGRERVVDLRTYRERRTGGHSDGAA